MSIEFDCFISYASGDVFLAEELHERLKGEGFSVWFDRVRLNPGFDWYKEIEAGCERSHVILALLTPSWKMSEWTRFETYPSDAVIPILRRGSWDAVKTGPLSRWQAHDLREPNEEKWQTLYASLRMALIKPVPAKPGRIASLRYRPNSFFVGREQSLLQICDSLHDFQSASLTRGTVCAISALGGMGKTTLANEYAHRFWRLYPQIFWIDARLGCQAEFARIYDHLVEDQLQCELNQSEKAKRALQLFSERIARLLIIDNVENEVAVSDWLPKSGDCRVIITSRFSDFSASVTPVHIEPLSPSAARRFLIGRAFRNEEEAESILCAELAKRLGYLPLALEIAAAFINSQGERFSFADYMRLYDDAARELLSEHRLGSTEYPDPIITTWKTTIAKLTAEARAILLICSCMADTPLPIDVIADGAEVVDDVARKFGKSNEPDVSDDELRMRAAVANLKSYSMATFDGVDLQFHPLVQLVERLNATELQRFDAARSAIDLLWDAFPEGEFEDWSRSERLTPHVERAASLAPDSLGQTLASLVGLTGWHLRMTAQFSRAEPLLRRALIIDEKLYAPDNDEVGADLNNLAILLEEINQFDEAEVLFRRALKIQEARNSPDDPEIALACNNLASVLQSTNKFAEAESLYRKALAIDEAHYGTDHPEVARDLNNLGFLLEYLGRWHEAETHYRRALAIDEKEFGPDHREVSKDLINLSDLLVETGRMEEGEPLCRRAIAIDELAYGEDHPEVATDLSSLAYLLSSANRFSEAESIYRRVIQIHENSYGESGVRVAQDLGYLADMLVVTNRPSESEPLYRRALKINEVSYAAEHPEIGRTLSNLADILRKLGRDDEALPLARRAVQILAKAFGQKHHWVRSAQDVLDSITKSLEIGER